MKLPTLYKVDTKGKIREWSVEIVDSFPVEIIVTHGAKDGAKQEKITYITDGKNIGRANETTAYEQAVLEANSKFEKQKDKCYSETMGEVEFRPMLAHRLDKYPKKVIYPCFVQPKLDGLRCNILYKEGRVIAQSRLGKEFCSIDSIPQSFSLQNNIILDGELYSDDITFQEIVSAVKRDEANDLTKHIKIHLYDLYDKNNPNFTFEKRYNILKSYQSQYSELVETVECKIRSEVDFHHSRFLNEGYEGTIIRNKYGHYKVNGRSYDLLKLKDFDDDEFKIISINIDKNNEAVFDCITKDGKVFSVKPKGTHEERVDYLCDSNIGKMLTIQYFGLTDDGVPRFPVGLKVKSNFE